MSDTQRDREERQHVIEVLQNMVDWMQEIDDIATPERIHALFYAIASIETDLKYDLLYEETSGQADKNDLGVSSGLEKNSKKLEKDFGESDCISRQATVKRLCNLAEFMNEHKEKSGAPYIMAALFIQDNKTEFPPVTPQEPKTGHWMGDSYGYICSNCEHSLNDLAQSMDYISFSKPKYCPNCGARMIEPQESEDKEQKT